MMTSRWNPAAGRWAKLKVGLIRSAVDAKKRKDSIKILTVLADLFLYEHKETPSLK